MNWQRLRLLKDAMRSLFDIQLQAVIIRSMYGPHGIQQEGRLFEIGEETGIESGEHRQGKIGKGQSWKYAFDCQNCGKRSAGRSGGANRFCRNECQQEYQVNRWFACSCCLARIGLGQNTAAKILGIVTKTAVGRGWKSKGIVAEKPKSGSMVTEGKSILTVKRKEIEAIEGEPQRLYAEAAMADIRSHRAFPNWSNFWAEKRRREYQRKRWHTFSLEKKRACEQSRDKNAKRIYVAEWKASKRASDPIYRMIEAMRSRLCNLVKSRDETTKELIGCSPSQLRRHLESKFNRGMTWANYGAHWHVDHVLPCSSFDHSDPKQRAQCWHWTNLEPLEAKANLEKSNRIIKPQMQLLLCASH